MHYGLGTGAVVGKLFILRLWLRLWREKPEPKCLARH